MRKIFLTVLAIFLHFAFFTNCSFAQDSQKEICAYLLHEFKTIESLNNDASLIEENKKLMRYFNDVCIHDPATLSMNFTSLKNYLQTTGSSNGKMRVYLWNTSINGAEISFTQFQTSNSIKLSWNYTEKELNDFPQTVTGRTWYDTIIAITAKGGKIV